MRRLPVADLSQQTARYLGGRAQLNIAKDLFQLVVPERLALGVLGLGGAVGVKQEAIPGVKRHVTNRVVRVGSHSERKAVAFDAPEFPIPPAQKRRMPRGGVQAPAALGIQPQISR